jgi:RES domain-containing protein
MRVWRISRLSYTDKLSGIGGLKTSGRWHHIGKPILYTSCTLSLAALEALVHFDKTTAPVDTSQLEIDIPDDISIEVCDPAVLTPDWKLIPGPVELRDFGTRWLEERRTAVLSVPSAIIENEKNYLINPLHSDFRKITLQNEERFDFDSRLINK